MLLVTFLSMLPAVLISLATTVGRGAGHLGILIQELRQDMEGRPQAAWQQQFITVSDEVCAR